MNRLWLNCTFNSLLLQIFIDTFTLKTMSAYTHIGLGVMLSLGGSYTV